MRVLDDTILVDNILELIVAVEVCKNNRKCESCGYLEMCYDKGRIWRLNDMAGYTPLDLMDSVKHNQAFLIL